ncbi:hypothetical protein LSCM4_06789 [Leishmania orientalis]|uniref:Uncharacterized protein n=1 Tax=Leishmania orientalis TaxID=2249476 RepID=A0A836KT82_9TRYP|nr:hypothetical protein LSCM4_06789 [Leishmania orientalis]
MSSNAAENPSVEKREEAHKPTTTATVDAATNRSSERGLKGWKNRLMNWRSSFGSTDGSTGGSDNGGTSKAAAAASDVTAKSSVVHGQHCAEGGKPSVMASNASEAVVPAKIDPASENALPARPINIWLRRALERQVESAIAEAIRDGKPLPEASVATVARVALEASAETQAEAAAGEPEKRDADTSAKVSAATPAAPKTSFAELMRRHREGLVPPSAQPPVKATKVVKRPKVLESPQPVVTPTATEEAPTQACDKKRAVKVDSQEHTAPAATPVVQSPSETDKTVAKEESEPTQTTSTTEADSGATPSAVATVHQAAVRKRPKATNSTSAKRTQETSAATSLVATPTHVTTVKGKASLEELRARRNRTTGGSVSHHNTPTPAEGGSGVASSSGTGNAEGRCSQQDEYTDSALDAVSRLLLRYCLGGRPTAIAPSTAAADGAGVSSSSPEPEVAPADESSRSPSETTTELDFFNELMALFENNSLTAASLELLRELFQHVRVLPHPPSVSSAGKGGESADAGASASQNGEAEMDAEAYREAARRREYVQQVIMVLLNRLKHMKAQEQRQRQQNSGGTTAYAAAAPPQPVLGHSAPLIKVGGMPLAPQPTPVGKSWISNTKCAPMPPPTAHQQQHSGMMCPTGQRTSSAAPWPSMVEMARACPDEAGAAAFTSAMMAYGYPNPYAHLTVFSQHQPVAPPVGWPLSLPSPTLGAPHDRLDSHIPDTNSNVAARLVASPFPGAFPIIPPPANVNTAGAEDREMQELFRMIRAQLTQPVNKKPLSRSTIGSRVESSVSVSGAPPVEVSPAERAVLRHVQMDFKKHLEQQQQQAAAAAVAVEDSSKPQTVSTPLTTSLTTPPETDVTQPLRLLATPGATADTSDPSAGAVTGTSATCARSEKLQHPPILLTHQAGSLQMMEEAARESFSACSTTALAEKGGIAADKTAPVKSRRTTLNLNAEPFVPGGARGGNGSTVTAIFAPAPTANSTPKKTTFNYHAKPFVPSGSVNAPPTIPPQNCAQISAAAQALAPPQQQTVPFSPTANSFTPKSAPPVNAFKTHTPLMPLPPGTAADPWASYELFARWRDMMENYYQHVFAMQHVPATATGMPSPSPTAAGVGSALSAIMTPPRPA